MTSAAPTMSRLLPTHVLKQPPTQMHHNDNDRKQHAYRQHVPLAIRRAESAANIAMT